MSKKVLGLILTVMMILAMLPALPAKADDPYLRVGDTIIDTAVSASYMDGKVEYDASTHTLTLNDLDLTYNGTVIFATGLDFDLTIKGSAKLTSEYQNVISPHANLILDGDFEFYSAYQTTVSLGEWSLTIDGGSLYAKSDYHRALSEKVLILNNGETFVLGNEKASEIQIEVVDYTVEVSVSPDGSGTVTGGGTYQNRSTATIKAEAKKDYEFVNWTEDGTEVSTEAEYSFTVEKDRSLVANFKEKPNPALSVTFYLTNSPDLPAGFAFGETANFGVTIINAGNTELTDVVITSDLTGDEWTFDSLAVYDIKTLQFSYDVTYDDVEAGSISTDAKATAKNPSDKATNINVVDDHADTVATPAELTFDLGGGTLDGKTGSITVNANVGQKINLPGAPTKEGYKFLYWKGSEYAAGAEYTVEGDHVFTAEWEEVKKEPETKPDTSPKTGDNNNAGLWAALMGGSLLAVILLITAGRKYRKKQR